MAQPIEDNMIVAKNTAETTRDIMENLYHHDEIHTPEGFDFAQAHLVSMPEKRKVEDLTSKHRDAAQYLKPARRKGTAHLTDLDSLIAWSNRFKGETSALFVNNDIEKPSLTCIADYHAEGPVELDQYGGDPTARHMHHRAIYDFPLSDEWKAWMKVSMGGKEGSPLLLEKDDLGEFIEAQAKDILDPTPAIIAGKVSDKNESWENRLIETAQRIEGRYGQLAQLLQMSKRFQVYETSNVSVTTNRDTGESEIQFLNEHKDQDGKPLNIPNLLIIAIPVFTNGAPYRMAVRFRYRKISSSVRFILQVYNPEKVFKAAITEAVTYAEEKTELPLFFGTPEA